MDMNLLKYLALVETVERGSVTRAGEALGYTQSGVSRMIRDLETDWGFTVLARDRSGVRLTAEGERLYPRIQALAAAFRAAEAQAGQLQGVQTGLIRLGVFSSVATHWLPNIIRAFQADYPGIDYELLMGDYEEIAAWTIRGRVDCGFLRLPAPPELDTRFLERDDLMAVVPEDHPLARLEKIPLAVLCDDPFLLLEKGGREEVSACFDRAGLTPRTRFTTWDDYAILSMVEGGLGVSILPRLILRRNPYRVAVRPLAEPAWRDIVLALRKGERPSPAVERFLDYLPHRNDGLPPKPGEH